MLCRRAGAIESSRRITQCPLDRTHESRRVEIRLAALTDGATLIPARINEWNSRDQIRADGADVAFNADAVIVAQHSHQRYSSLNASDAAQALTADQVLDDAGSFR